MGRQGSNRGFPAWYYKKGNFKFLDFYSGEELFNFNSNTTWQEGKHIHKKNFDSLTEKQREESIKQR